MENEKKECYCCHKIKEGTNILASNAVNRKSNIIKKGDIRFVCNDCNHLESKNE